VPIDIDAVLRELRGEEENKNSDDVEERVARIRRQYADRSKIRARTEKRTAERLSEFSRVLEGPIIPVRLRYWFRHDTWTVSEALILLCGFSPDHIIVDELGNISPPEPRKPDMQPSFIYRLDGLPVNDLLLHRAIGSYSALRLQQFLWNGYEYLHVLWKSGDHDAPRYSPKYFIDWATRKEFKIVWLDWAVEQGLVERLTAKPMPLCQQVPQPQLTTTERNTLLTIIAALCHFSGIEHQNRGVAGKLEKMTEEIGAPVTDDTIREVLKKIPDAVDSRRKY
jgi:hypothetical protein